MTVGADRQVRFAWLVVGLLFAGSVINYVDRAVLGVVMPQVRRDLGLTNTAYALAINAFLITYMVFYILGGRVADRLGYTRMFTVTLMFWSAASMLHALARGLLSLALFRALLGIGEGGYYPAAMRGAAGWFPPEQRAKAVGVVLCGISVGMILTPPAVAWVTHRYGWRAAFLATGALGLLLVAPWMYLHRRIQARGAADPKLGLAESGSLACPEEIGLSVGEVLQHRKYWCILAARSMTDAAWYFYLFWMPGYFQEARGFSLQMVGGLLWIPYLGADAGALGGAWASSALIQRGWGLDRGRKAILIPAALLGTSGGLAYFAAGPYVAIALITLALFGHQSWSSNIHTVITEITPPKHVAVLYGITGAAGTLMGAVSQLVIGPVVDAAGYGPAFVGAGAAYLAAIALLLAAGRIEPMRRSM